MGSENLVDHDVLGTEIVGEVRTFVDYVFLGSDFGDGRVNLLVEYHRLDGEKAIFDDEGSVIVDHHRHHEGAIDVGWDLAVCWTDDLDYVDVCLEKNFQTKTTSSKMTKTRKKKTRMTICRDRGFESDLDPFC